MSIRGGYPTFGHLGYQLFWKSLMCSMNFSGSGTKGERFGGIFYHPLLPLKYEVYIYRLVRGLYDPYFLLPY